MLRKVSGFGPCGPPTGAPDPQACPHAQAAGYPFGMTLRLTHLIGGESRPSASGATLEVFDPATGAVAGTCAAGDAADVEAAVAAAQAAFPAWSALPAPARAQWLARLADALESRIEAFA